MNINTVSYTTVRPRVYAEAAQVRRTPSETVGPAYIVDISPEAHEAYARSRKTQTGAASDTPGECETCKNRRYKDGSNDASVSFQAPTRISPEQAASAVASHEREHVTHEQVRAKQEGRRIVSQTVSLKMGVCPECGRIYVAGGVTRTVTAKAAEVPVSEGLVDVYA